MRVRGRSVAALGAAAAAAGAAVLIVRDRRRRSRKAGFVQVVGSRAARTGRIARLGARRASATAWHQARRTFASAPRRVQLDEEQQLRSAQDVAAVLGEMKGALAKLG